jgi:hypothetical protein
MKRMSYRVTGRVQGVGFRAYEARVERLDAAVLDDVAGNPRTDFAVED